jgi:hypothetical protein
MERETRLQTFHSKRGRKKNEKSDAAGSRDGRQERHQNSELRKSSPSNSGVVVSIFRLQHQMLLTSCQLQSLSYTSILLSPCVHHESPSCQEKSNEIYRNVVDEFDGVTSSM